MTSCREKHDLVSVFPLENYDQNISTWIKFSDPDYDQPQINEKTQRQRFATFYKHYLGTSSPWNKNYVTKILQSKEDLKNTEKELIGQFDNKNKPDKKIGYGENFHAYSSEWIEDIATNIHLSQFDTLPYDPNNRAIAIDNLHARILPTLDPFFYHHRLAGEGYPFDNLQMSAIWAGTPLYILGTTRDQAWNLVISPDLIAWVKSIGIARVDNTFAKQWEKAATKQLAAIIHTKTPVIDTKNNYRFMGYVGSFFPAQQNKQNIKIMIPIADARQKAMIHYAFVSKKEAVLMPIPTTPHYFSHLFRTLLGRPYGWGNMYFYNDCSAELKNLFTPFGIWLPRHSSDQMYVGKLTDLSHEPEKKRMDYLMVNGRRFSTLVYVGGHVLLFIGNYVNPHASDHALMPMTFQNMWGLKPNPPTRRAVIGKSVLFPILEKYPEDRELVSQAGKKYFQLSQLDQPANNLQKLEIIDLKRLMSP